MRKFNYICLVIFLLFIFSAVKAQSGKYQAEINTSRQNAITQAIKVVSPAVAGINVTAIQEYVTRPFFNDPLWNMLFPEQIYKRRVKSLGSGVVISSDGYVVTNTHVVEGAEEIIVTLIGGKEYKAKLVGIDQVSDIALLKLKGKDFSYARMGSSDDIIIGEWVVALGNPFGLFNVNYKPTATVGIISACDLDFGRQHSGRIYQDMIQTDASINTGNSGGPLVNSNGEVIGINTFIFTGSNYSEGSIGIGFAIPIDRVKSIVSELKKHGKVDRSFKTGLSVQNIDGFLARYLGLSSTSGVIVTEVKRGSSAHQAGIKVGDVIIKVNDKEIHSDDDIFAEIEGNFLKAGDTIKILLLRGRKRLEFNLELE
ncbi:MAG: 2-alkenal reductase [Candidatus Neomarinimicrobiota bacterium]|nr:MAG: 2-alkenal reductase [Candidatus Neomarinimicrobiota bacterium]